ncbi:MAG: YoaK family protein [bacterium]
MMFSKENRTLWDDTKLGFIFGFFGGYNNAAAVIILLYEIAPMSANWGGMAKAIGHIQIDKVFTFIPLILCFISGAFIGSKWAKRSNPVNIVIAESLILMSVAFFAKDNTRLAITLGALAMGLQNGMSTLVSHHAVRTSHLTSTVTDIGIGLARRDYKGALVKSSKAFTYMWGAVVGTVKAGLIGNMVFALGGLYLMILMIARIMVANCESCKRRGALVEEWFTQVKSAPAVKAKAKPASH